MKKKEVKRFEDDESADIEVPAELMERAREALAEYRKWGPQPVITHELALVLDLIVGDAR